MNPKLKIIITGSGRCGTNSIADYLDGLTFNSGARVSARHETEREKFLTLLDRSDYPAIQSMFDNFTHQVEVSPYISLVKKAISPSLPLLALVRDGRNTVTSGMNAGWFTDRSDEDEIYRWERFLPNFKGDRFSKCCQLWAWIYEKLDKSKARFVKLEDLANDKNYQKDFLTSLGIRGTSKVFPRSNQTILKRKIISDNKYTPNSKEWDKEKRLLFRKYCGAIMHKYYPLEII